MTTTTAASSTGSACSSDSATAATTAQRNTDASRGAMGKDNRPNRNSGEGSVHSKPNDDEDDVVIVTDLNPNDVLCGRGSGPNDHVGNINFRILVNKRKREYLATTSRSEKARIAREITSYVGRLDPPGRFLRKADPVFARRRGYMCEVWCVVDEETALEKAKQALRQHRVKDQAVQPQDGGGAALGGSDTGCRSASVAGDQRSSGGSSRGSASSITRNHRQIVSALPEEVSFHESSNSVVFVGNPVPPSSSGGTAPVSVVSNSSSMGPRGPLHPSCHHTVPPQQTVTPSPAGSRMEMGDIHDGCIPPQPINNNYPTYQNMSLLPPHHPCFNQQRPPQQQQLGGGYAAARPSPDMHPSAVNLSRISSRISDLAQDLSRLRAQPSYEEITEENNRNNDDKTKRMESHQKRQCGGGGVRGQYQQQQQNYFNHVPPHVMRNASFDGGGGRGVVANASMQSVGSIDPIPLNRVVRPGGGAGGGTGPIAMDMSVNSMSSTTLSFIKGLGERQDSERSDMARSDSLRFGRMDSGRNTRQHGVGVTDVDGVVGNVDKFGFPVCVQQQQYNAGPMRQDDHGGEDCAMGRRYDFLPLRRDNGWNATAASPVVSPSAVQESGKYTATHGQPDHSGVVREDSCGRMGYGPRQDSKPRFVAFSRQDSPRYGMMGGGVRGEGGPQRQESDKSFASLNMSSGNLSLVKTGALGDYLERHDSLEQNNGHFVGSPGGVGMPPRGSEMPRQDSDRSCRASQIFTGQNHRTSLRSSMLSEKSLSLSEIAKEFVEKRRSVRMDCPPLGREGGQFGKGIKEGEEETDSGIFDDAEELAGQPRPVALMEEDPDSLDGLGGSSMSIVKAAMGESSSSKESALMSEFTSSSSSRNTGYSSMSGGTAPAYA